MKAHDGQEPGMEDVGEKRAPLEGPASAKALRLFVSDSQLELWEQQVSGVTGRGRARWAGLLRQEP